MRRGCGSPAVPPRRRSLDGSLGAIFLDHPCRWPLLVQAGRYDLPGVGRSVRLSSRSGVRRCAVLGALTVAWLCGLLWPVNGSSVVALLFLVRGQLDDTASSRGISGHEHEAMSDVGKTGAPPLQLPLGWVCVLVSLALAASAYFAARCFWTQEHRCVRGKPSGSSNGMVGCICGQSLSPQRWRGWWPRGRHSVRALPQVPAVDGTFQHVSSACLSWLCHYGFQLLLLAVYVAADTGKMLLVGWANRGRSGEQAWLPSSLLLVQLLVSLALALGVTGGLRGFRGLALATRPWDVICCMPVAAFFFLSKTCTVAALGVVDAGTVKLSTQLILPCTALLSVWLIPGRGYSKAQWNSIITICVGTLAFHSVQLEADVAAATSREQLQHRRQAQWAGLSLCGAVIVTNSLGSVVGERFLKGSKDVPLVCIKAQLVLAEIFVVLLVLGCLEAPRAGKNWFAGWDWRVLVCALGWVPATWMSTIITARFSTVIKNVVQCVSTLVTYFLAMLDPEAGSHSPPATLVAMVVILSVFTFTLQSGDAPKVVPCEPPPLEEEELGRGRSITQPPTMTISGGRRIPKRNFKRVDEDEWEHTWSAACGDLFCLSPTSDWHSEDPAWSRPEVNVEPEGEWERVQTW